MMNERPILFSTPMIQAILGGEKTQTRRIIKTKIPIKDNWVFWSATDQVDRSITGKHYFADPKEVCNKIGENCTEYFTARYGYAADQLWCRESFVPNYDDDGNPAYKANWNKTAAELIPAPKWKPSIHMPRNISRIQLEITDLKVERVQDITEEDAMKEGMRIDCYKSNNGRAAIPLVRISGKFLPKDYGDPYKYKSYFAALWDELNKKRGYGWETNPFVWIITFRRIK
jgi:hypothetical protein